MLLSERQSEILHRARSQGRVEVEALAAEFEVTTQTIRRDLNDLSQNGLLARVPQAKGAIDDVVLGCAMPEGEQGLNVARLISLLADLSAGLDWDAALEAGLLPAEGTVDTVVFALSPEERAELHRLLQEALAGAGA